MLQQRHQEDAAGAATVLVTGGSGFVASHCISQLLASGFRVKTTVRSQAGEERVREVHAEDGTELSSSLSFVNANLSADPGWEHAVDGCSYVLHVASPLPSAAPKNENEIIEPALGGTMRVLRAAHRAGVRRVVLTSSFAAISHPRIGHAGPYTEADWTDPVAPGVSAYTKAKILAEKAAWDFVRQRGAPELAVVNPAVVLGPMLSPNCSTSILLIKRMLDGGLPFAPQLCYGIADVRDVADLHIRAMLDPAARGERFIAVSGKSMSIIEIGNLIRSQLGQRASRVAKYEAPNWAIRLLALVHPTAKQVKSGLGERRDGSNDKARSVLGWAPRSNEEAIMATCDSLLRLKLVKQA